MGANAQLYYTIKLYNVNTFFENIFVKNKLKSHLWIILPNIDIFTV